MTSVPKNDLELAIENPQMELWVAQLKKVLKEKSKADLVRRCAALTVEVFLLQKAVKIYEDSIADGAAGGQSDGDSPKEVPQNSNSDAKK